MENKYSTSGIGEDIIRSFTQIASAELHAKTLLEKRISEMENGMIEDDKLTEHLEKIDELKEEVISYADIRRTQMLYLYKLFGAKGDKEQWCMVKHLSMAMYTSFEAWQASDNDEELLSISLEINKKFIMACTKFLGVEITSCASCFADIMKGLKGVQNE